MSDLRFEINNKADFYDLAKLGMCGNTPRTWYSLDEYLNNGKDAPEITVRRKVFSSKKILPVIHRDNVIEVFKKHDIQPGTYVINEIPPSWTDEMDGLQGELTWLSRTVTEGTGMWKQGGLAGEYVLYFSEKLGYMREKLAKYGKHAFGYKAIQVLKKWMFPGEVEQLIWLIEKYQSRVTGRYPVIEFAVTKVNIGILSQHLLIWEVRNGY